MCLEYFHKLAKTANKKGTKTSQTHTQFLNKKGREFSISICGLSFGGFLTPKIFYMMTYFA
jgi:esterase/lipase